MSHPLIQLNNTNIRVNNLENDQKTGRTNFTTKCREEVTSKKTRRATMQSGSTKECGLPWWGVRRWCREGQKPDFNTGEPVNREDECP